MSVRHVLGAVSATWDKLDTTRARARFAVFFFLLVLQNLGLENLWLGIRLFFQYHIILPWFGLVTKGVSYADDDSGQAACDADSDLEEERPARHCRQALDIYLPNRLPCPCDRRKVLVFVHGGAWGSGDAWQYGLLGRFFAAQHNIVTLVVTYRIFPDGNVAEQICDVRSALIWAKKNVASYGGDPNSISVFAHSAGAHLVSMALLGELGGAFPFHDTSLLNINLNAIILAAGVYDIGHHYRFEAWRGVSEISTMTAAMGGWDNFALFSPVHAAKALPNAFNRACSLRQCGSHFQPKFLHGDLIASVVTGEDQRPPPSHKEKAGSFSFPPMFLMTSGADATVPFHASVAFYRAMVRVGLPARLLIYDGVSHADFVTDYMEAFSERDHRCHLYAPFARERLFDSEKTKNEHSLDSICGIGGHMHPRHVEDLLHILSFHSSSKLE